MNKSQARQSHSADKDENTDNNWIYQPRLDGANSGFGWAVNAFAILWSPDDFDGIGQVGLGQVFVGLQDVGFEERIEQLLSQVFASGRVRRWSDSVPDQYCSKRFPVFAHELRRKHVARCVSFPGASCKFRLGHIPIRHRLTLLIFLREHKWAKFYAYQVYNCHSHKRRDKRQTWMETRALPALPLPSLARHLNHCCSSQSRHSMSPQRLVFPSLTTTFRKSIKLK